jgi:hypothetical protein
MAELRMDDPVVTPQCVYIDSMIPQRRTPGCSEWLPWRPSPRVRSLCGGNALLNLSSTGAAGSRNPNSTHAACERRVESTVEDEEPPSVTELLRELFRVQQQRADIYSRMKRCVGRAGLCRGREAALHACSHLRLSAGGMWRVDTPPVTHTPAAPSRLALGNCPFHSEVDRGAVWAGASTS